MTKTELIDAIAKDTSLTKEEAHKAVDAITKSITTAVKKGDKVQLVGFGTFEVAKRAARTGHNPQTGETIKIAACKTVRFKAGKALKDSVNKK